MLAPLQSPNGAPARPRRDEPRRGWLLLALDWLAGRVPFVTLFIVIFLSNAVGSVFNIGYNTGLIVKYHLDPRQQQVFHDVALPLYNAIVYPIGIGLTIYLLLPLARYRKRLRAGRFVAPAELELCRMRLVNLPFYQVLINFLGWLPGAAVFPLLITTLGGSNNAQTIWVQFAASFVVSAALTTAQTFFVMEWFLMRYFYPDFFQEARPAEARGVIRIRFGMRLFLMGSTMLVPLLALLLVAWNFDAGLPAQEYDNLRRLAVLVAVIGAGSSAFIFWLVGYDVSRWVNTHAEATGRIEMGNYDVCIQQKRPDEFGLLNDRFNDMVAALGRARQVYHTFGQIVSPEIRDEILQNYQGLEGQEQQVTVLFADIRGFTRRSSGQSPERVVELLNRFLTVAVDAVEAKSGGWVCKFLGDGFMALFNVRRLQPNHADQAVVAARELLRQLDILNAELASQGDAPLCLGIGIHSGPALVGCIGAKIPLPDGNTGLRKELTAIGETVNLAQRMEQLTKCCPGPILLSEQTRQQLRDDLPLISHGPQQIPGYDGTLVVYQLRGL
jgi:adenylate cyclase